MIMKPVVLSDSLLRTAPHNSNSRHPSFTIATILVTKVEKLTLVVIKKNCSIKNSSSSSCSYRNIAEICIWFCLQNNKCIDLPQLDDILYKLRNAIGAKFLGSSSTYSFKLDTGLFHLKAGR